MKYFHWLLLAIAAGAVALVVRTAFVGATRPPEDLLASAAERLERQPPDLEGALRELNLAVEFGDRTGDDALLVAALELRADLLSRREAFPPALEDFQRLLELPGVDRDFVRRELASVARRRGELDAAISQLEALLAESPDAEGAALELGRALSDRVARSLDEVADELVERGSEARLARAAADARLLVHLDASDPEQAALAARVLELVHPAERDVRDTIAATLAAATADTERARDVLGDALALAVDPDAVQVLLELLLGADRPRDAVDVGLAAVLHGPVANDVDALWRIAQALYRLGRPAAATTVVRQAMPPGQPRWIPNYDERREWVRILYDAEEWLQAESVGQAFLVAARFVPSGRERDEALGSAVRGFSLYELGRFAEAREMLAQAVTYAPEFEPWPHAHRDARNALALIARFSGDESGEAQLLRASVRDSPDENGEAWLRLAELHRSSGRPLSTVLSSYAQGMAGLPERSDELEPAWRELGEQDLERRDLTVDQALDRAALDQLAFQPTVESPYLLLRLAERHLELDDTKAASTTARALLDRIPGFLPAEDVLTDVQVALGRSDLAVSRRLDRIERAGPDDETIGELRLATERGELSPAQRLRMLRADPLRSGVLALGRAELEAGRPEITARALERAGTTSLGAPGRLLAADTELALGRPERALLVLRGIGPRSRYYTRALRRAVDAALQLGDPRQLQTLLAAVAEADLLEVDEALPIVDALLARKMHAPARTLLEHLDARPETRGPGVVLRLCTAHWMAGDRAAAHESLERAEAFLDDGRPAVGRVLMAAHEGRWLELPVLARALRTARSDEPGPLEAATLAALEERLGTALELLSEDPPEGREGRWAIATAAVALLAGEEDTRWPEVLAGETVRAETLLVLRGTPEGPRDPRQVLALLLALEHEEWAVWSMAELLGRDARAGTLWPLAMLTHAEARLGNEARAIEALERLTSQFPSFAPGWDHLERLERARKGRVEDFELLELAARRLRALAGDTPAGAPAVLVLEARELEEAGRLEDALERATAAVDADPTGLATVLERARLLSRLGRYGEAVDAYGEALTRAQSELASLYVEDFVGALDAARGAGAITATRHTAEVEALSARLPDDPLVALALARLELVAEDVPPAAAAERALLALDAFRERVAPRAVEELRAGAAAAWLDLLLALEPDAAEEFVEAELARLPEVVSLWHGLGLVHESLERRAEAIAQYELLTSMVPHAPSLERLAALHAALGGRHGEVVALLQQVSALTGRPALDPALALVRARSMVNSSEVQLRTGVELLAQLWERRDQLGDEVTPVAVGQVYGAALLRRGDPKDRDLAERILLECADGVDDPLREDVLRALAGLARNIPGYHAFEVPSEDAAEERIAEEDAANAAAAAEAAADEAAADEG